MDKNTEVSDSKLETLAKEANECAEKFYEGVKGALPFAGSVFIVVGSISLAGWLFGCRE